MNPKTPLSQKLTTFEGVFCSGFLIPGQSMVTALSLLFEKVHFLNQLEYVIELSKKYQIKHPAFDQISSIKLIPTDQNTKGEAEDPLAELSPIQRQTVLTYLFLGDRFFIRNACLFPKIFSCSLLPKGEVLSVKLIKKGRKGELNTYEVTTNPLVVTTGGEDELTRLLNQGGIPIFGGFAPSPKASKTKTFSPTEIAAALAIKTVAMVLPATCPAEPEVILEARDKLRDHLPLFWSSMLKLSAELSQTEC